MIDIQSPTDGAGRFRLHILNDPTYVSMILVPNLVPIRCVAYIQGAVCPRFEMYIFIIHEYVVSIGYFDTR